LFAGGSSYTQDGTGIPIRRIDIYDVSSNAWSTKDLNEYPTWRLDMGIAAVNDKIFIAGGGFWGDDIYTNQVDIYNTTNDIWSIGGLSEFRTGTAGASAGNKVFFAGGYLFNNGSNYWSNTVDIYEDANKTWTSALLSERRGYIVAVAGGNKIYFAGGQKNDGHLRFSDRIDEYDIVGNSMVSFNFARTSRGDGYDISRQQSVFAGGQSTSGESGIVEIRDVVSGETSFGGIVPRAGFSAVLKDTRLFSLQVPEQTPEMELTSKSMI